MVGSTDLRVFMFIELWCWKILNIKTKKQNIEPKTNARLAWSNHNFYIFFSNWEYYLFFVERVFSEYSTSSFSRPKPAQSQFMQRSIWFGRLLAELVFALEKTRKNGQVDERGKKRRKAYHFCGLILFVAFSRTKSVQWIALNLILPLSAYIPTWSTW